MGNRMKVEEMPSMRTYRTKDYGFFLRIKGNREVQEKQVRKLMELMKKAGENALAQYPIDVNSKFEIIDGQHRLQAASRLGFFVYYRTLPEATIETVRSTNVVPDKWKTPDITGMFSELGNDEYSILKQFAKHYNIGDAIAQSLLSGSTMHEGVRNLPAFESGKFKVTSLSEATTIMSWVTAIEPKFTYAKSRAFIVAIQKLFYLENFEIERLLRKFSLGLKPEKQSSAKNYLLSLQELYNFAERECNRMHFIKA